MNIAPPSSSFLTSFVEQIKAAPLGVYDAAKDSYKLIPAAIDPLVINDDQWREMAKDSQLVLSAMQKTVRWLRKSEQRELAQAIFSDLAPNEKSVVMGVNEPDFGLATVRLDLFFDRDELRIIEVNATIPAMQAYTDMIKHAYVSAKLTEMSETRSDIQLQSNVGDLLASLLLHYELAGGKKSKPKIAVISRKGDSQTAELLWIKKRWEEAGHDCILGQPEDVVLKNAALRVKDIEVDLTYRHIFASRLLKGTAFEAACNESRKYKIFNPISAHLEIKGLLAETSRLASDPAWAQEAGFTPEECDVTQTRVPWSRLVRSGAATIVNGEKVKDLVAWLKANNSQIVVKRSSGYGGHDVIIGDNFFDDEVQSRVAKIIDATQPVVWADFIEFCARQNNGVWIVQQRVPGKIMHCRYLEQGKVIETDAYVDCSIFASTGIPFQVGGGACRLSPDPIVNIGRGGGLVPFLLQRERTALSSY
ncbi:MAG: hypothetical protein AB7T49_15400 [Oligoflexales bacterium]